MIDAQTGAALLTLAHEQAEDPPRVLSATDVLVWSSDGARIATLAGKSFSVWDARTGKPLYTLRESSAEAQITAVTFDPTGRTVMTASRSGVRIWDANKGTEIAGPAKPIRFDNHEPGSAPLHPALVTTNPGKLPPVSSIALSPDGRRVLLSNGDSAAVWDVKTGDRLLTLGRGQWITAVWSPSGTQIAVTEFDQGRVVDAQTGAEMISLHGPFEFRQVSWSPNGERLLTWNGNGTWLWDAKTGARLLYFAKQAGGYWSPDGTRVLLTGRDGIEVRAAHQGGK